MPAFFFRRTTRTHDTKLPLFAGLACALAVLPLPAAALSNYASVDMTARAAGSKSMTQPVPWVSSNYQDLKVSNALAPVAVGGMAEQYGFGGLQVADGGFANTHASAWATNGALGLAGLLEVQARQQADGYSAGDASLVAKAYWEDRLSFSVASLPAGTLLRVSGSLLLDGFVSNNGTTINLLGYGTGMNFNQNWTQWSMSCTRGSTSCSYTDANFNSGSWTSGTQLALPFVFYVANGGSRDVTYSLQLNMGASVSFAPCANPVGGACSNGKFGGKLGELDFGHTLAWGGATVTDEWGNPLNGVMIGSQSGFDYSRAYAAAVPEPSQAATLAAGLAVLAGIAWRRRQPRRAQA
jgi:hypothetical protein